MEILIAAACLLGLYLFRNRTPAAELDKCGRCGGKTKHYCGMGACVDMCPKCDVLGGPNRY
jgi:hypothetical protein